MCIAHLRQRIFTFVFLGTTLEFCRLWFLYYYRCLYALGFTFSHFKCCLFVYGSVHYDPCSIRGGARLSVMPLHDSLVYPPSPNYSLLEGSFVSGDCGPGAVVVVVTLMCELFPNHFEITKAPKYAVEVRCLLAVLLMTSTMFESHFETTDLLYSTPRPGTLFSGFSHGILFYRNIIEDTDSIAWRRRLALSVCSGEGSLLPNGRRCVDESSIVWFTLDVVYSLVDYFLRLAFVGDLSEFEIWRAQHGLARHSQGPICYVPGAAPWRIPIGNDSLLLPYDPYGICVLHVETHFQVHVRRTEYSYGGVIALTCPYQQCPARYNVKYARSPKGYRMHVEDPGKFAHPYLAMSSNSLLKPKLLENDSVQVSLLQQSSLGVEGLYYPGCLIRGETNLMTGPPILKNFRYYEPLEAVEQVLRARGDPLQRRNPITNFGDFPVRLPAFDVLLTGLMSRNNSLTVPSFAEDDNFKFAFRSRQYWSKCAEDAASFVPRGDPKLLVPISNTGLKKSWVLAVGHSTVMGRSKGLFVFDDGFHSQSEEMIVDRGIVVGWFAVTPLRENELHLISDDLITELCFPDGPRYFRRNSIFSSIQCNWFEDGLFRNNCVWILKDDRVGIQTEIPFVNCEECFLPFGWTYGPTHNQSPFVCYQIWQGYKDTILGSCTPFHHRLGWILTKDFIDPSPRYLLRKIWKLPSDPPGDVLGSVSSYSKWVESVHMQMSIQASQSAFLRNSSDRSGPSLQLAGRAVSQVRDSNLVFPKKKTKPRQRRRIAAAIERSLVINNTSPVSDGLSAKRDLSPLPSSMMSTTQSFSGTYATKRQRYLRRNLTKWKKRYLTVHQQMWMALQVLAAEPSELHFSDQLRDIAREFSSTPDCSDTSEYISKQRTEGNLLEFDFDRLWEDEAKMVSMGLDAFIESRFVKYPGLGFDDLYTFLSVRGLSAEKLDRMIALLEFGQSPFMVDTFVPNGCSKMVKNGVGYDSHRVLCEHTAAKLYSESRCVLVRENILASNYMNKDLHVSPCNTVHKEGAVKRVVTDLSHGKDRVSSYNHSVDLDKHLEAYPRNALPTLRHVATLACQMRREHKDAGLLHGGIVDVRTAYQQYRLSVSKAKLVCTRLFTCRQINGRKQEVAVIMIALTGTFGDVGAGDTYAILGDVFHELHNAVWALWRSVTYVDDMIILAPPFVAKPHPYQVHHPFYKCEGVHGGSAEGAPPVVEGTQYVIHQAVTYARNLIGNVLGAQATEPKKTKWFYGCLVGIGWYFNLVYSEFYVLPKPEKLRKIVHYLFNVIPVGSDIAPYTAVRELQGLLCWFSAALPLGKSFVYSLFRCRPDHDGLVSFSAVAIRDLDFWRSLARCAMIYPNLFGAKLENLEFGRKPSWFIRTDASTGHGGGGWLSKANTWLPGVDASRCFALRWTADEVANINKWVSDIPRPSTVQEMEFLQGNLHHYCSSETNPQSPEHDAARFCSPLSLDINVLEFATAVFAMMLWAPLMQGSCVCLGADNTATLCWLIKYKTTNLASDVILKMLALTCAVYNVQLVAEFIPGVRNVLADWLSRVSTGERWDMASEAFELCGGSQGFFRENLHSMAKDPVKFPRRLIVRTLLMRSLTVGEPVTFQTLLAMILALKGETDLSCDIVNVELKGTLNGIAAALLLSPDGTLEVPMNFDAAVSKFYVRPIDDYIEKPIFPQEAHREVSLLQTSVPRVLLCRRAKSIAIEAIRKTIREPPFGAYRIPEIDDLPGVQVSIAPSTLTGAGLGLFLTRGPARDGSAPKGTRLAKYEGRSFVTAAEISSVENSEYHLDYLWGKLNPLTRVYTIIDAEDPKSCYTRYVNEGFFDSNCEVVLGIDDVLYLTAVTDIALNEEMTMPYGAAFWTFPERWLSLSPLLRDFVLQFYDCVSPVVPSHQPIKFGFEEKIVHPLSGFGPAYSSDTAGDGPREGARLSGWGGRQESYPTVGKAWKSILLSTEETTRETRDKLKASFPLLHLQAMASCHAPSTLRSYNSGWNSWSRYCKFFERNILCEKSIFAPMPFHAIIVQIQEYIHFECAIRQMQPDSIKNVYLAGIADYFDRCGTLNRFREASNHNCVQLILTSYSRSWKKKHPDSTKVKIAFGLSYAIHAEHLIQSGKLEVGGYVCSDRSNLILYMIGVRVVTAMWLGIFFLLRKNEFLPYQNDSRGMQEPCRRRNLRFFDKQRLEIKYDHVGLQLAASVSLNLSFSKTDQTGHGRIIQHESTDDQTTCVVRRLEEYIRVSRDYFHATADSLLFSVPGLPSDLSCLVLTTVMKDTTTALGLPANLVSAHSLRYGGATALSQAGFPEYIIAFYGGWVNGSVAMRRYIGHSAETRRVVSAHMAKTAYASSVEALVRETLAGRAPDNPVLTTRAVSGSNAHLSLEKTNAFIPRKRNRIN